MKYVVAMMVLALFAGRLAVAADSESVSTDSETSVSQNPVTGTVKHKTKMSKKHKDMAGHEHTNKMTKTRKDKTDGSSTTTTETEEHHD